MYRRGNLGDQWVVEALGYYGCVVSRGLTIDRIHCSQELIDAQGIIT